jgi:hypothetical protein
MPQFASICADFGYASPVPLSSAGVACPLSRTKEGSTAATQTTGDSGVWDDVAVHVDGQRLRHSDCRR